LKQLGKAPLTMKEPLIKRSRNLRDLCGNMGGTYYNTPVGINAKGEEIKHNFYFLSPVTR